ncbi:MAG: hypothetical protein CVV25_05775 [Ignavibacteriae bacterium HGW-Ignavibacteriae-4]|nr:MAG: hypothetical protein CVV25_05775 [Ignavibacteriae bacterium HGW-Ignavibacteriae-4]
MDKSTRILKVFLIMVIVWGVITLITLENNLESDGSLNVGFPFTFYTDYVGKTIQDIKIGFGLMPFISDLFIIFAITYLIILIYEFAKKKMK